MAEIYQNSKEKVVKIKYYVEKAIDCLSMEMKKSDFSDPKSQTEVYNGYLGIKDVLSEAYIKGALDGDYVIDKGVQLENIMREYKKQAK